MQSSTLPGGIKHLKLAPSLRTLTVHVSGMGDIPLALMSLTD